MYGIRQESAALYYIIGCYRILASYIITVNFSIVQYIVLRAEPCNRGCVAGWISRTSLLTRAKVNKEKSSRKEREQGTTTPRRFSENLVQVIFTIMCLEWLTTYICKPPEALSEVANWAHGPYKSWPCERVQEHRGTPLLIARALNYLYH